jgi:hypothetical protein
VPVRLKPADPALVAAALDRVRSGADAGPGSGSGADAGSGADLRLLTKHFLALLTLNAPGGAVEVRVPPYAVAQCVAGTRHTRGTPPAVVETDPRTWVELAVGDLRWDEAERDGRLTASGERSDLGPLLPLA